MLTFFMCVHLGERERESVRNLIQPSFLDATGVTGKTFVTLLLSKLKLQQKRFAVAVLLSGFAAIIFPGGRTANSTFHLSLNLVPNVSAI